MVGGVGVGTSQLWEMGVLYTLYTLYCTVQCRRIQLYVGGNSGFQEARPPIQLLVSLSVLPCVSTLYLSLYVLLSFLLV